MPVPLRRFLELIRFSHTVFALLFALTSAALAWQRTGFRWLQLLGILLGMVLGGAVLFWVSGFDILYACQDVEFARRARLHSVPAWLGVRASLRLALGCHVVMVGLLLALYWAAAPVLGAVYLIGVGGVALL